MAAGFYRVDFTDTARDSYATLLESGRRESANAAAKKLAAERISEIRDGVIQLESMDPMFDVPLVGKYFGVNALTSGQSEIWYARHTNERVVTVLQIGEASADTTSIYHLFADLVLSGKFNTAMSPLGVAIPMKLPHRRNLRLQ